VSPRDVETELGRRNWELAERVKELVCLHGISRLRERQDLDLEAFVRETVQLVPSAWQFPSLAVARVRLEGRTVTSGPFPPAGPILEAPIRVDGEASGTVEVGYPEGLPLQGGEPFLKEERTLLETIAERIGAAVAHSRATSRITAYQSQLRSMASELALSSERERRQIAQELHDQIGHNLAAMKFRLTRLRTRLQDREVDEVLALLEQTIRSSRNLTFELSPPVLHELGLGAALEWLVHQLRANHGIAGQYLGDRRQKPLSEDRRIVLFQAVRELLTNVGKHSRASMARVETRVAGRELHIDVVDDGVGFETAVKCAPNMSSGGMGLFSVRERLAHLGIRMEIDSAPGRGTRVHLAAPLQDRPRGLRPAAESGAGAPEEAGRRIRILLAEDQTLAREGLRSLLEAYPDLEVVAEASDGEEAVAAARSARPDVVVMDIAMPRMNGLEATRRILAERPATKVVALSMHSDSQYVLEMLRAGASGYLLKDCAQDDLAQAIRVVEANLSFLSPGLAAHVASDLGKGGSRPDKASLTPRELRVLELMARGLSAKESAAELEISPKTIETHRHHLMEKLGIDNVAGLTRYAIREGLVRLEEP
jgi:DNA-binding NarL/FixJ family response regulator/signal transduction histidine kinase